MYRILQRHHTLTFLFSFLIIQLNPFYRQKNFNFFNIAFKQAYTLLVLDKKCTICGIQQMTKVKESTAMSLAKALSSAVIPISDGTEEDAVKSGLHLDEALEILLRTPFRRPRRFKALDTVKLHQTIDTHRIVPKNEKRIFY